MAYQTDRRRLVAAVSGGLATGIAGCLGGDGGGNGDDEVEGQRDDESASRGDDEDAAETDDEADVTDEIESDGLVYAFGPETIALVDPAAGEVVDEITADVDGYTYGDAVPTSDGPLFVIEETLSQVLVIDAAAGEIVDDVAMGPEGTHMYHPNDDELWAHSDAEGTFYVVDTADHEVVKTVEAGLEAEGHGKLLSHEDFGSTGYATNVNDPAFHVIDMDAYERTDSIDLGDEGGTHYKAYSPQNGLAYVERSGGVGTTAVVDVEINEGVDELDVAGGIYLTPDEELLGIIDGGEIHFFDATSADTDPVGSVAVEGGPDALEYYDDGDTVYGFTANTMDSNAAVVDVDALEVVDHVDVGDIERPEGAEHLHRSGVSGGGYFVTPAGADGTVAVVDMETRDVAHVEVEEGIDTVQYVDI